MKLDSDVEKVRRMARQNPAQVASWEREIIAVVSPFTERGVSSFVVLGYARKARFVVKDNCVVTVLPERRPLHYRKLTWLGERRRADRARRAEMQNQLGPGPLARRHNVDEAS